MGTNSIENLDDANFVVSDGTRLSSQQSMVWPLTFKVALRLQRHIL